MGCHVTSTSRSASSSPLILSAGADTFLHDTGDLSSSHSGEFQKVLELVGITTLKDSLRCCGPPSSDDAKGSGSESEYGVLCMTGIAGGKWSMDDFEPMSDIPQGVALTRYSGGIQEFKRVPWDELVQQVKDGRLRIQVGKTWKLEEIAEAHRVMEEGGAGGKMVIVM
jgi:NADPH:quinone reductase-like Zn-dependent oxidoreductase